MSNSVWPHRQQPTRLPVPGILQARTLEWIAISFSSAWKWKVKVKLLSCIRLLATPWLQPTRLLCPWDFPGKTTEVGCHCLLPGLPVHHHIVLYLLLYTVYSYVTILMHFPINFIICVISGLVLIDIFFSSLWLVFSCFFSFLLFFF